ncbi:2-oxo acid dehydrogenase subunit E2 [Bremerella volcania]|nr:2-oxo acid dehydrogenase subunit E2 [Bremerella volcania]
MPAHRALVTDLMWLHRTMPTVSQVKTFDLSELRTVRKACPRRISWAIAFLRAYALTALEFPSLRRTYLTWPWPHLYEHPQTVGNLVVSRQVSSESWLFFAPIADAENFTLDRQQGLLERYQTGPVEEVFKNQVRLAHYPFFVRRLLWWLRFHGSPGKRIKRLGTFAVTTVAGQGVTILDPRAPVTSTLTYGPINEAGQCSVTIAYDHRVMDGKEVAEILIATERIMQTRIVREFHELAQLHRSRSKAA